LSSLKAGQDPPPKLTDALFPSHRGCF